MTGNDELPLDPWAVPLAALRELDGRIAAEYGPPLPLARIEDGRLPPAHGSLRYRLYQPAGPPTATVAYFHGGGWVAGSIESHDGLLRDLADAAQCAVVSFAYRLAPEHRHPAAHEDARASLE